jgi:hypothetical protein
MRGAEHMVKAAWSGGLGGKGDVVRRVYLIAIPKLPTPMLPEV